MKKASVVSQLDPQNLVESYIVELFCALESRGLVPHVPSVKTTATVSNNNLAIHRTTGIAGMTVSQLMTVYQDLLDSGFPPADTGTGFTVFTQFGEDNMNRDLYSTAVITFTTYHPIV